MAKDKEAAALERKRRQRPLGEEAKKEHAAYDVLDGPFATIFHKFFKRRIITKANMKPYPWFIGGIHRAARMLDVADVWERAVLLIFPLPFLLAWLQPRLGVPPQLQGLRITAGRGLCGLSLCAVGVPGSQAGFHRCVARVCGAQDPVRGP